MLTAPMICLRSCRRISALPHDMRQFMRQKALAGHRPGRILPGGECDAWPKDISVGANRPAERAAVACSYTRTSLKSPEARFEKRPSGAIKRLT